MLSLFCLSSAKVVLYIAAASPAIFRKKNAEEIKVLNDAV